MILTILDIKRKYNKIMFDVHSYSTNITPKTLLNQYCQHDGDVSFNDIVRRTTGTEKIHKELYKHDDVILSISEASRMVKYACEDNNLSFKIYNESCFIINTKRLSEIQKFLNDLGVLYFQCDTHDVWIDDNDNDSNNYNRDRKYTEFVKAMKYN